MDSVEKQIKSYYTELGLYIKNVFLFPLNAYSMIFLSTYMSLDTSKD